MKRGLIAFGLLIVAAMFLMSAADAAPVWAEVYSLIQPDGTFVDAKIWGDEFYQVVESLDGYTLVRDPDTGVICYAELSRDGKQLLSTGLTVGDAGKRGPGVPQHLRITPEAASQQAMAARARFIQRQDVAKAARRSDPPQKGNVKALCIIVDFPDEAGTIPPADVDALCNEVGYSANGNNGSVRDYFYDVSNGLLTYTNYVPSAYYTALHNKSYYDNPSEENGPKAAELIGEALQSMESAGFDFSQYDANHDGYVDGVNCLYVGYTHSGWSRGLWPHSGIMAYEVDGVVVLQYQITEMGNDLTLGTFCHENGHMICRWPDLYDYDYDSRGAGRYCLMASGGHGTNPVEPCAYLKYRADWTTNTVLPASPRFGLTSVVGSNEVFILTNPYNTEEYYLIENRQKLGRDLSIPDAGLAIWHVDQGGSNSWNQMTPDRHFQASLVQADGRCDLEHDVNSGDASDLWKAPLYTLCGPATNPNTNWWSGDPSYLRISNISASSSTMTFDYRGVGLATEDSDDDGISDLDETRDLDPSRSGIQNPFEPMNYDVTGNSGTNTPDGTPDGDNDYDNDGVSNGDEFRAGSNPLDPHSGLPVDSLAGLLALGSTICAAFALLFARRIGIE